MLRTQRANNPAALNLCAFQLEQQEIVASSFSRMPLEEATSENSPLAHFTQGFHSSHCSDNPASVRGSSSSDVYAPLSLLPDLVQATRDAWNHRHCVPLRDCLPGGSRPVSWQYTLRRDTLSRSAPSTTPTTAPLGQYTLVPTRSLHPGNNFGTVSFCRGH